MTGRPGRPATLDRTGTTTFHAIGTTAHVVVADPGALPIAEAIARDFLAELDRTCSRFRPDSELMALPAGRWCSVSPLLAVALDTALQAAELTGGLVDPTVAEALCDNGYDRDFDAIGHDRQPSRTPRPAPGWWRIGLAASSHQVLLPRGVRLDLGATAKALAADLIAARVNGETGTGVLVSLGGDIAVAGAAPAAGWRIRVGADHTWQAPDDPVVVVSDGGLATSSTARRRWRHGSGVVHHIVDPRTGRNPRPCWATVSVAAASCVDANTATTAAIVLGPAALAWLAQRRLPARLVSTTGDVETVASWPAASSP